MPPPNLVAEQVAIFSQLAAELPAQWSGKTPRTWAASIAPDFAMPHQLSPETLTREDLIGLWRNEMVSTEACFLSTMAWGGMKKTHGVSIWNTRNIWLPVCDDIRQGLHSRRTGFDAFHMLRTEGMLPGMGPAYFTKILFFAMPNENAYILDQWTARSIHLLTNDCGWLPVQIDYASRARANLPSGRHSHIRAIVTDRVEADVYEDYCSLVEQLAVQLRLNSSEVEERMFGIGGRTPSPWRNHVMNNWYDLFLGGNN